MNQLTFSQFNEEYCRLYKEEDGLYRRLARSFGLTESAFWCLYIVQAADRPITQTEVCSLLMLSKQTINSALKGLEETGHIQLSGGPGHRKYICLTETGRTLTEQTVCQVLRLEERAFLAMTEQEREALLTLNCRRLSLLRQEFQTILTPSQEE